MTFSIDKWEGVAITPPSKYMFGNPSGERGLTESLKTRNGT